jgi:hypothetical protein
MKATSTILGVAMALAAGLVTDAQARGPSGGSSGGRSTGYSNGYSSGYSTGYSAQHSGAYSGVSSGKTNVQTANYQYAGKPGPSGKPATGGMQNGNKGLPANPKMGIAKSKPGSGAYKKPYSGKNWWKKNWWDYCGFGCGGWDYGYCVGGCDWDCCQSWYECPMYNVCGAYSSPDMVGPTSVPPIASPDTSSATSPSTTPVQPPVTGRIAHIVNPAETQATLGFAIDGKVCSLDAGQTRDVEVTDNTVIEFNRGSENDTVRYQLSEGMYQFASAPQGWELYHSSDSLPVELVADN